MRVAITKNREEDETHSNLVPGHQTTMMLNTMRNTGLDTQQYLPLHNQTNVRRRNSDLLDNTIEQLANNLQNMDIDEEELQAPRGRPNMMTEIGSEDDSGRPPRSSTRMQLHTDLGIMANNRMTNPSPNSHSTRGDITFPNSQRLGDTSSSRTTNRALISKPPKYKYL